VASVYVQKKKKGLNFFFFLISGVGAIVNRKQMYQPQDRLQLRNSESGASVMYITRWEKHDLDFYPELN